MAGGLWQDSLPGGMSRGSGTGPLPLFCHATKKRRKKAVAGRDGLRDFLDQVTHSVRPAEAILGRPRPLSDILVLRGTSHVVWVGRSQSVRASVPSLSIVKLIA
ncbi:MAG: hypothetical protein CVV44_04935 [Spirochaetae bacterium HGW-Spirochaetae-1]|nr:MAG: hypothetical protein CVV44_04935 [Spirochaetae bacterium HGW-Spirochaetae-1]